jgi:DNA-binding transcriptional regulator YbjK
MTTQLPNEVLEKPPRSHRRRGIERRTQILEATLRVLADGGAASLTHRAVAAEANVPLAATAYYFDSKEDLLMEAFRLHAEREARRVIDAATEIGSALTKDQLARQLARFLYEGLHSSRHVLLAEFEFLLQATRKPGLGQLTRVWYETMRTQLEPALEAAGSTDPSRDARLILAVLAGIEIDNLATPDKAPSLRELEALLTRLVDHLL